MSRPFRDDLAYGDLPQRWDRDRFERAGTYGRDGGRRYEEDDYYRAVERDGPGGRRDVAVAERERIAVRSPPRQYEERDRLYERERYGSPIDRSGPGGRRRRTDRELFGDVDPRELAGLALTPYRAREDLDIDRRREAEVRPAMLRRRSSLDTFDRRPKRYEDDYRIPAGVPVPLPVPRVGRYEDEVDEYRYRDSGPYYGGRPRNEDYRDVEIRRERSVHRRSKPKSRTVASRSSSSSSQSTFKEVERSSHGGEEVIEERRSSHHSRAPTRVSVRSSRPGTVVGGGRSVHESIHESIHKDIDGDSRHPSVHESFHEDIHRDTHGSRHPSVHESIHESFHEDVHEDRRPSVHESVHESIHESIHDSLPPEPPRLGRKGKTRMPKRLVRVKALMDLGYPFEEEEDFLVVRVALEKDQIDEVIRISEEYKATENKTVYKYEEKVTETEEVAPVVPEPATEREEVIRTEWINPPTVVAEALRSPSLASAVTRRSGRSRAASMVAPDEIVEEERRTIVEEHSRSRAPSRVSRRTEIVEDEAVVEERAPSGVRGSLVVSERVERSDRDIHAEIRALEAERRALRLERDAEEKRDLALRLRENPNEELALVGYRERFPRREVLELVERERSPPRNVLRVEKDRKERRNARVLAAAMATLT